MSTAFEATLVLSSSGISNKYILEDLIETTEQGIQDTKSELKMYASSNVKDLIPEDWEDEPISWLSMVLNDKLEYFEELLLDKFKLNRLRDEIEAGTVTFDQLANQ